MPPQSRGQLGGYSKSTPNLTAIQDDAPSLLNDEVLGSNAEPSISRNHAGTGSREVDDEAFSNSSFEREFLSQSSSEEEEDEEDEDGESDEGVEPFPEGFPPPPPHPTPARATSSLSPASRSQSYLGPAAFAPPFYNRPPTPLPPSPSLTSLLRPLPFSAAPSRPATPNSSDTEDTGTRTNSTAAAVEQSARNATTVPRASPKVPTYEYYGFVLYLGSSMAFFLYLLWSYLPTPFLHQLGIYYYPNRWWSLAIPAWLVVAILYVYVALAAWNTGVLALPLQSLECLVDEKARVAVIDGKGRIVKDPNRTKTLSKGKRDRAATEGYGRVGLGRKSSGSSANIRELDWRNLWNESTDAVMDVPIGGVCEILYGEGREDNEEDTI